MADRLRKGIKSLPDLDKRQLEQLEANEEQSEAEATAEAKPGDNAANLSPIVTEVLAFGRIPKQIKRPTTKEDHDENNLANRLSKKQKSLSDVDKRQLELLKENAEQADAEAMAEPEAGANAVLEALPNE